MSRFKVETWDAKRFPGAMCIALLVDDSERPQTVYGVWSGRTRADAEAAARRDNFRQMGGGLDGRRGNG